MHPTVSSETGTFYYRILNLSCLLYSTLEINRLRCLSNHELINVALTEKLFRLIINQFDNVVSRYRLRDATQSLLYCHLPMIDGSDPDEALNYPLPTTHSRSHHRINKIISTRLGMNNRAIGRPGVAAAPPVLRARYTARWRLTAAIRKRPRINWQASFMVFDAKECT